MKIKVQTKNNEEEFQIYSNHIPRYREFINRNEHRYMVEYVNYNIDEISNEDVTDVSLIVTKIF